MTGTLSDGALAVGDVVASSPAGTGPASRRSRRLGRDVERDRTGAPRGPQPGRHRPGRRSAEATPWSRRSGGTDPTPSTPRSMCSPRSTTRCHVAAPTSPTSDRGSTRCGCACSAPSRSHPASAALVRMHLPAALPLLPGDRYVLRESGRDETVGGGEILDVAPVRARRSGPTGSRRSTGSSPSGLGSTPDELDRLTGRRRPPNLGRWIVDPAMPGPDGRDRARAGRRGRARPVSIWRRSTNVSGPSSTNWRALRCPTAESDLRRRPDPLADHPGRRTPWPRVGFVRRRRPASARPTSRALQRRGVLVERDGVWFHDAAIATAAALAARLLAASPGGFTVADFREAADTTRKYALPLANELDARGITRRRGDHAGRGSPSPGALTDGARRPAAVHRRWGEPR